LDLDKLLIRGIWQEQIALLLAKLVPPSPIPVAKRQCLPGYGFLRGTVRIHREYCAVWRRRNQHYNANENANAR
jgi:hypothetical protein